ncbi:Flap-structured DNA-binding and RNA-binding protein, partial [Dispira simplex]
MATQRPISDSFHLGASKDSSGNPQPQGSALGPTGNPSLPGQTSSSLLGAMGTVRDVNAGRPASEVYLQNAKHQSVSEAELIDRWFEDLAHFEKTLDELASASLDPSFKDELMAIEQWFLVLSEAERTASLYALLQHISPVQVRFFLTTLQQLAQRNPMTALLTSGAPYAGDDKDSGAKGASLGMLDRHSISGSPVGLGKPGQQRMSATAASLAGVSKNLGLNPNLSLPNATSTFSNRWSLSSLAANNNSAGTMEPIGRPSSLMGSGEALSSGLWRRTDLGMDAGKVNSGSRGKTAGNLHLRPDRPGSALGGEMASLSNNTWGFSSSSNIVGMNESQPPVTERPKSATDFDLTPDWRAVSNSNRSSRNINEPEIKSSLRQSLGDDSNILGEHRAAGKIGVNSGVTTNIPGEPPAAGGSLAARRLGAHKFSVATYDSSDGQISVALKSPLKSPMFAGGLKGTRATGSRPTTPALPPGFYQHPQSPWGLNSNAPPGGV